MSEKLHLFNPGSKGKSVGTFAGRVPFDDNGYAEVEVSDEIKVKVPDYEQRFANLGWLVRGPNAQTLIQELRSKAKRVITHVLQGDKAPTHSEERGSLFDWSVLQDKVSEVLGAFATQHPWFHDLKIVVDFVKDTAIDIKVGVSNVETAINTLVDLLTRKEDTASTVLKEIMSLKEKFSTPLEGAELVTSTDGFQELKEQIAKLKEKLSPLFEAKTEPEAAQPTRGPGRPPKNT